MKWWQIAIITFGVGGGGFVIGLSTGFQLCANRIRRGYRVPVLFSKGFERANLEDWNQKPKQKIDWNTKINEGELNNDHT